MTTLFLLLECEANILKKEKQPAQCDIYRSSHNIDYHNAQRYSIYINPPNQNSVYKSITIILRTKTYNIYVKISK